ncbi:hypothetical protein [Streptomyces albogriseolus]|uniref:hypothetical protein n=1 Tax=Streptomyces albogriseolus TaxID=1887 RepID=UPI0037B5C3B3
MCIDTQPIRSLDDLTADTFESDEELEEFLAFTYAERHRDAAWGRHVQPVILDTDVASLLDHEDFRLHHGLRILGVE